MHVGTGAEQPQWCDQSAPGDGSTILWRVPGPETPGGRLDGWRPGSSPQVTPNVKVKYFDVGHWYHGEVVGPNEVSGFDIMETEEPFLLAQGVQRSSIRVLLDEPDTGVFARDLLPQALAKLTFSERCDPVYCEVPEQGWHWVRRLSEVIGGLGAAAGGPKDVSNSMAPRYAAPGRGGPDAVFDRDHPLDVARAKAVSAALPAKHFMHQVSAAMAGAARSSKRVLQEAQTSGDQATAALPHPRSQRRLQEQSVLATLVGVVWTKIQNSMRNAPRQGMFKPYCVHSRMGNCETIGNCPLSDYMTCPTYAKYEKRILRECAAFGFRMVCCECLDETQITSGAECATEYSQCQAQGFNRYTYYSPGCNDEYPYMMPGTYRGIRDGGQVLPRLACTCPDDNVVRANAHACLCLCFLWPHALNPLIKPRPPPSCALRFGAGKLVP